MGGQQVSASLFYKILLPREVKTRALVTRLVGSSAQTLLPGPQLLALNLPFFLPLLLEVVSAMVSAVSASRNSTARGDAAMGSLSASRPIFPFC